MLNQVSSQRSISHLFKRSEETDPISTPSIKIQGAKIKDLSLLGVSPSPLLPLRETTLGIRSPSPIKPSNPSIRNRLRCICVLPKIPYNRNQAAPKLALDSLLTVRGGGDTRWRIKILKRVVSENGRVSFALGSSFGNTVTRMNDIIPYNKILDFVTPHELERYENEDYLAEFVRDRERLANAKPRGRPRKFPLPAPQHPGNISGTPMISVQIPSRRGRGRPRKSVVPSFQGPEPVGKETSPESSESDSSLPNLPNRGVYSMVAASGIANGIEDSEVSREASPSIIPDEPIHLPLTSRIPTPKPVKIRRASLTPYFPQPRPKFLAQLASQRSIERASKQAQLSGATNGSLILAKSSTSLKRKRTDEMSAEDDDTPASPDEQVPSSKRYAPVSLSNRVSQALSIQSSPAEGQSTSARPPPTSSKVQRVEIPLPSPATKRGLASPPTRHAHINSRHQPHSHPPTENRNRDNQLSHMEFHRASNAAPLVRLRSPPQEIASSSQSSTSSDESITSFIPIIQIPATRPPTQRSSTQQDRQPLNTSSAPANAISSLTNTSAKSSSDVERRSSRSGSDPGHRVAHSAEQRSQPATDRLVGAGSSRYIEAKQQLLKKLEAADAGVWWNDEDDSESGSDSDEELIEDREDTERYSKQGNRNGDARREHGDVTGGGETGDGDEVSEGKEDCNAEGGNGEAKTMDSASEEQDDDSDDDDEEEESLVEQPFVVHPRG